MKDMYEHLDHFAYYPFLGIFLIVACDKEDKPIGYIAVRQNKEVGKFYIYPEHRGGSLVHLLLKEALSVVKGFGMKYVWGLCFERMHKFYTRTYAKDAKMYGYSFKFAESPEERDDGQWLMIAKLLEE